MNDIFSDEPLCATNDFDAFDCKPLARKVATLFEKRSGPPFNIAVYGPWGSGKSSLLYFLKRNLDETLGKDSPLWIGLDAWAYQTDDSLIFAIIADLYSKAREPVKESLLKIAVGTTLSLADLALKVVTGDNLSAEDVGKHLELAEDKAPLKSKQLVLRGEFERLVTKLKKSKSPELGRHVLIAIDNLDRCKPDTAVRVLETLFLIGNTTDCTFLIAVDQQVLISFLNRYYQGTGFNGSRYLEKIFPLAFRIPDPWVYWSYEQALRFTRRENVKEPDQVYTLLDKLLSGTHWDDRASAVKTGTEEDSIFATAWHYLAQPRILRNPRRIKRMVRYIRNYEPDDQPDAETLLFLVILSDLWPDAFEFLLSTDGKTWSRWIDHLAGADVPAPANVILLEDHGLRDLLRQIWGFYDAGRHSMKKFKDCPIRKQDKLLYHLKHLRELGL